MDTITRDIMIHELTSAGMPKDEAAETVPEIGAAASNSVIDKWIVARMLASAPGFVGIADKQVRFRAAERCLAQYIISESGTKLAKWAGLQMYCGMTELAASAFLEKNERQKNDRD